MAKCTVKIPLGYSPLYWGSQSDGDGGVLAHQVRRVLGDFENIGFRAREISRHIYEITVYRSGVPTSGRGKMEIEESFAGVYSSMHRMKYGEILTIGYVHENHDGTSVDIVFSTKK